MAVAWLAETTAADAVVNLACDFGYATARDGEVAERVRVMLRLAEQGAEANHDLLRALRIAEAEALAGLCDRWLHWSGAAPALNRTPTAPTAHGAANDAVRWVLRLTEAAQARAQSLRTASSESIGRCGVAPLSAVDRVLAAALAAQVRPAAGGEFGESLAGYLAAVAAPLGTPPESFGALCQGWWLSLLAHRFRREFAPDGRPRACYQSDLLARIGQAELVPERLAERDGQMAQALAVLAEWRLTSPDVTASRDDQDGQASRLTEAWSTLDGWLGELVGVSWHVGASRWRRGRLHTQFHVVATSSSLPPVYAAVPVPAPPNADHFAEREADVEAIVAALAARCPVALLGPAGIGLTSLAAAALADPRVAGPGADRRYYADLRRAAAADTIVSTVVAACGVKPSGADTSRLVAHLAQSPAALVLDHADAALRLGAKVVDDLLRALTGTPGLGLIVALRGEPRTPDETLSGFRQVRPRLLSPDAALGLFRRLTDRPSGDNAVLRGLLAKVDGLPLAVTLLAAAARLEPDLAALASRWDSERARLTRSGAGGIVTGLDIAVAVALASEQLTDQAKRLLRALAELPDGLGDDDLAELYPHDGRRCARCLRAHALLDETAGRLRLPGAVAERARAQLPPDEVEHDRVAEHFAALSEAGKMIGRDGAAEVVARLAAEAGNIEAALHWLVDRRPVAVLMTAFDGYAELVRFTGIGSEAPLRRAAARAEAAGDTYGVAEALLELALTASGRGDRPAARSHYEHALLNYQRMGDLRGQANCVRGLGNIALDGVDAMTARAHYEQAVPLYQQAGDVVGQAGCEEGLGRAALLRSDYASARAHFEQALPLYERAAIAVGQANCLHSLGELAMERADHAEAGVRYGQALPLYQQIGDAHSHAHCLQALGEVALAGSRFKTAMARFEQALAAHEQAGSVLGQAGAVRRLGDLVKGFWDHPTARRHYQQALAMYESAGADLGRAWCEIALGDVARDSGDLAGARLGFERAAELALRAAAPSAAAMAHLRLAAIAADGAECAQQQAMAVELLGADGRDVQPAQVAMLTRQHRQRSRVALRRWIARLFWAALRE
ncbi:MAG: hypothetical protein HZB16_12005 [Armatimonadetes bacterium]|nr:hypothetical protein [Armatimonadota bacterium]